MGNRAISGVTKYLEDVRPIAILARGVVDKRLNLEADQILQVDDRNGYSVWPRESLGPFEHPKSGTAEGVEQVDPPERGIGTEVV